MRSVLLSLLLVSNGSFAQEPSLPLYERHGADGLLISRDPSRFDSLRKAVRLITALGPKGMEKIAVAGSMVLHEDECCTKDDPFILVLKLERPVVNDSAYTAFFPGEVAVAPWPGIPMSLDSIWRDTIHLFDPEGRRASYFFAPDSISGNGLTYRQYDRYTGERYDRTFATPRANCTARTANGFAAVRCARDTSMRAMQWGVNSLFLFSSGKPVLHFWDWSGTSLDNYGPFAYSYYDVCGVMRLGEGRAYVLTSGEVVWFNGAHWAVAAREPNLYYGECDCDEE